MECPIGFSQPWLTRLLSQMALDFGAVQNVGTLVLFQLRMLAIPFRPPRDCSQGIASYDCDSCNLGSVLDWTADPMSRGNHTAVNDIHMMHLLRYLFFMETFSLTRTYILREIQ